MTDARPFSIAVEAAGRQSNPHLAAILRFAADRDLALDVTVLAASADDINQDLYSVLGERNFKTRQSGSMPDGVCAFFPVPRGDETLVREALLAGAKVFQTAEEDCSDAKLDDLEYGFLRNNDAEWYARIFPDPVHLADPAKIMLGLGATINPRAIVLNAGLEGRGGLVDIGRASHLGADLLLNLGSTDFRVGNFTMISANFAAHPMRHSITHISNFAITKGPFKFFGSIADKADPIAVGHDVWVGDGVKCLPGASIGNGAVVGAGSVVTKPVEPYAIYAGNPAKLIRYRFDKQKIAFLNECGWWDLSFGRLREIREAFQRDVTNLPLSELKAIF